MEFHYSRLTDVEAVPYRLCGKQAYIVTLSHPNLRGGLKDWDMQDLLLIILKNI